MKSKSPYPTAFLAPALVLFGGFFVLPTLMGFYLAFTRYSVYQSSLGFTGWANFTYLFQHPQFLTAFWNTFEFAFFSTLLKTFIGLMLALLLVRPLRGGGLLRTVFYMPAVLSPIIAAVMFQAVFRMDGLLNTALAAVGLESAAMDWMGRPDTVMGTVVTMAVWKWAGFNMAIFIAGLQAIPVSYYEAASIDGASGFTQLRRITLPLIIPALGINLTSNLIGGLNVFEQVLGLTGGGPGYASQVIGTLVYQSYSQGYYGRASAMGMIQIVITLVLGVLLYKGITRQETEA